MNKTDEWTRVVHVGGSGYDCDETAEVHPRAEELRAAGVDHPHPESAKEETCPRCGLLDCSPECIAAEQAEIDAYAGPLPKKYA